MADECRYQGLIRNRIRLLRRIFASRALQVPVYPVCMDAHGTIPDRGPGAFHHEQRL